MSDNAQPHLLNLFKDSNAWAGGMAHQLREFDALSEDLGFDVQVPHGDSQSSIIPVPGNPMTSSDFHEHQAHVVHS